ncbi:MAG: hypothetical protein II894_01745 [Bacteroidales bacterium]|nr:hypothetical protein [Bacteroidales bacterium]
MKSNRNTLKKLFGNRKRRKQKKMSERSWNQVFSKDCMTNTPHYILEKSSSFETYLHALAASGDNIKERFNRAGLSIQRMAESVTKMRESAAETEKAAKKLADVMKRVAERDMLERPGIPYIRF